MPTTTDTITAPLTAEDEHALLALPRRNACRQYDALLAMLQEDGCHPDQLWEVGGDRLRLMALSAGFVVTEEALGPRGGRRSVIRERVLPEYRAGLAAALASPQGWKLLLSDLLLGYPDMLRTLGDHPGLVELWPVSYASATPRHVLDGYAAVVATAI